MFGEASLFFYILAFIGFCMLCYGVPLYIISFIPIRIRVYINGFCAWVSKQSMFRLCARQ